MDVMDREQYVRKVLAERIKANEGFRLKPYELKYNDATGKTIQEKFSTVGYGHKILPGEEIPDTKEGLEMLFMQDLEKAIQGANSLNLPDNLPNEAYGVMVEMVFQMGTKGVSKFKNTLNYIRQGDYGNASVEMLDSRWATQTPHRAMELSTVLKNSK